MRRIVSRSAPTTTTTFSALCSSTNQFSWFSAPGGLNRVATQQGMCALQHQHQQRFVSTTTASGGGKVSQDTAQKPQRGSTASKSGSTGSRSDGAADPTPSKQHHTTSTRSDKRAGHAPSSSSPSANPSKGSSVSKHTTSSEKEKSTKGGSTSTPATATPRAAGKKQPTQSTSAFGTTKGPSSTHSTSTVTAKTSGQDSASASVSAAPKSTSAKAAKSDGTVGAPTNKKGVASTEHVASSVKMHVPSEPSKSATKQSKAQAAAATATPTPAQVHHQQQPQQQQHHRAPPRNSRIVMLCASINDHTAWPFWKFLQLKKMKSVSDIAILSFMSGPGGSFEARISNGSFGVQNMEKVKTFQPQILKRFLDKWHDPGRTYFVYGGHGMGDYLELEKNKLGLQVHELAKIMGKKQYEGILFDACFMANLDCVYHLRNNTKFVGGCEGYMWEDDTVLENHIFNTFTASCISRSSAEKVVHPSSVIHLAPPQHSPVVAPPPAAAAAAAVTPSETAPSSTQSDGAKEQLTPPPSSPPPTTPSFHHVFETVQSDFVRKSGHGDFSVLHTEHATDLYEFAMEHVVPRMYTKRGGKGGYTVVDPESRACKKAAAAAALLPVPPIRQPVPPEVGEPELLSPTGGEDGQTPAPLSAASAPPTVLAADHNATTVKVEGDEVTLPELPYILLNHSIAPAEKEDRHLVDLLEHIRDLPTKDLVRKGEELFSKVVLSHRIGSDVVPDAIYGTPLHGLSLCAHELSDMSRPIRKTNYLLEPSDLEVPQRPPKKAADGAQNTATPTSVAEQQPPKAHGGAKVSTTPVTTAASPPSTPSKPLSAKSTAHDDGAASGGPKKKQHHHPAESGSQKKAASNVGKKEHQPANKTGATPVSAAPSAATVTKATSRKTSPTHPHHAATAVTSTTGATATSSVAATPSRKAKKRQSSAAPSSTLPPSSKP